MPSPIFAFRLPAVKAEKVRELAKIYGSPNPSAFCRDLVDVISSGDADRLVHFHRTLQKRLNEQLVLDVQEAQKPPLKRSDTRARGKRGGKRGNA